MSNQELKQAMRELSGLADRLSVGLHLADSLEGFKAAPTTRCYVERMLAERFQRRGVSLI